MNGAVNYKLLYPVTTMVGDDVLEAATEVTIRRPTAKDMRVTDDVEGIVGKSLATIAQLTGLLLVTVDNLDVADMIEIGQIIEGFTSPGPKTGGMS